MISETVKMWWKL